jgi:hypothetical protein
MKEHSTHIIPTQGQQFYIGQCHGPVPPGQAELDIDIPKVKPFLDVDKPKIVVLWYEM